MKVEFIKPEDTPFVVALSRTHHQVFHGMDLDDPTVVLPELRDELVEHLKGFVKMRRKIKSLGNEEKAEVPDKTSATPGKTHTSPKLGD